MGNGDYYIEVYRSADAGATQVTQATLANSIILVYFDFTVAQTNNTKYTGRIFCNKWGFITYNHAKPPTANVYNGDISKSFQGDFFGYTADSIICKVNFQTLFKPLAFNLAMTKYGIVNNGNWINDRRSIYTNSTSSPALSGGYKVFLNQPDLSLFPASILPNSPVFKSISGCPGNWSVVFSVENTGDVQVLLDLNGTANYQAGTSDRIILVTDVVPGNNTFIWNGKDGLGATISGGVSGSFIFSLLRGSTNIPMFDAETNTNGFSVDGILPSAFNTRLYWCDTALNATTNNTCTAPTATAAEIADNNSTGLGIDNSIAGTTGITQAWDGPGANLTIPAPNGGLGSSTANLCDDFGNARTINTWFWPTASSASNFSVTVPTGCLTLPIKNLQFTGITNEQNNALSWTTEEEENVQSFELEKSYNSINFQIIAIALATRNTTTTQRYSFIDKELSIGRSYYRLKIVHADGTYSYSKVIGLQKTVKTNSLKTLVYPNPVTATSVVSYQLTKPATVSITIKNSNGSVLYNATVQGKAGLNEISLGTAFEKLSSGLYFITTQTKDLKNVQRILNK